MDLNCKITKEHEREKELMAELNTLKKNEVKFNCNNKKSSSNIGSYVKLEIMIVFRRNKILAQHKNEVLALQKEEKLKRKSIE